VILCCRREDVLHALQIVATEKVLHFRTFTPKGVLIGAVEFGPGCRSNDEIFFNLSERIDSFFLRSLGPGGARSNNAVSLRVSVAYNIILPNKASVSHLDQTRFVCRKDIALSL